MKEIKFSMEPVRSLAFGSIGAAYMGVGTVISNPARQAIIQNFTDTDLMFSINGVEDHFPVKASSAIILDLTANKTVDAGFFIEEGTRLYVKEIDTPTEGSVYFSVIYGAKE